MKSIVTKDLAEQLTDRQILLELRQAMAAMTERMSVLKRRTNPLAPNYDERFTAMEERLVRVERKLNTMASDVYDVRATKAKPNAALTNSKPDPVEHLFPSHP